MADDNNGAGGALTKFDEGVLKGIGAQEGELTSLRTTFLPTNFAEAMEMAKLMAAGRFVAPHLRGKPGDCLAVVMQSHRWGMDPFAVANKSYFVNDRMAYEAQLVAAVVNTSRMIDGRLHVEWFGESEELLCIVTGQIKGEPKAKAVEQKLKTITTRNSPLWKQSPRQQLGYYTQRLWARLYAPEVLMGVYTVDEIEDAAPIRGQERAIPARPNRDDADMTIDGGDLVTRVEDGELSAEDLEKLEEKLDRESLRRMDREPEPEPLVEPEPKPKKAAKPRKAAEPKPEPEPTPEAKPEPGEGESPAADAAGPSAETTPASDATGPGDSADDTGIDWNGWLEAFKEAIAKVTDRKVLDGWRKPDGIPAGFENRARAALRARIEEIEEDQAKAGEPSGPADDGATTPDAAGSDASGTSSDQASDEDMLAQANAIEEQRAAAIIKEFNDATLLIDLRSRKAAADPDIDAMGDERRRAVLDVFRKREDELSARPR